MDIRLYSRGSIFGNGGMAQISSGKSNGNKEAEHTQTGIRHRDVDTCIQEHEPSLVVLDDLS
jgi:hypothetical protein